MRWELVTHIDWSVRLLQTKPAELSNLVVKLGHIAVNLLSMHVSGGECNAVARLRVGL